MLDQLGNGPDAGAQGVERQHLRFIKDNDALRDVVNLSALGGAAGVKAIQKTAPPW